MSRSSSAHIMNNRLFAILCLGFASGLPLALTGSTLQAWFTVANVDLSTIGILSLIGMPYTLKFLWAPFFDHYSFKVFGKRVTWILLTQLGILIALILLANGNPSQHAYLMAATALILAFFSASQDIGITAYQTDISRPEERGLGVAYYTFAYRIALLIAGGIALIAAEQIGWRATYYVMAGLMLVSMLVTMVAPRPVETTQTQALMVTITAAVSDLMQRENIILLLAFIVLYKFGDALALQLMSNFLLHGLGFSLSEVGIAFKIFGLLAVILGGFAGGFAMTRLSSYKALLIFGLMQSFSNLMFVVLAVAAKSYPLMISAIFIENFCSGLSTAALIAFLMSLCNHRYSASQYALLSALATSGRVLLGPLAAAMVAHLGWTLFYIWSFLLCFPSLILLVMLKNRVLTYADMASD